MVQNYQELFIAGKTRLRLRAATCWTLSSDEYPRAVAKKNQNSTDRTILFACTESSLSWFARFEEIANEALYVIPEAIFNVLSVQELTSNTVLVSLEMQSPEIWFKNWASVVPFDNASVVEWEHIDEQTMTEEEKKWKEYSSFAITFLPTAKSEAK